MSPWVKGAVGLDRSAERTERRAGASAMIKYHLDDTRLSWTLSCEGPLEVIWSILLPL